MSFAAISQHLRILEQVGAGLGAPRGAAPDVRIAPSTSPRSLCNWTDQFAVFFNQRLDALGEYLDKRAPEAPLRSRVSVGVAAW